MLKAVYDRCLDFDESRIDSIEYYAAYIERQSKQLHFAKGDVLSLRLRGLAEELRDDYSKAAEYYLLSLEAARKLNEPAYEVSALSDLAILYANIDQPGLAKNYYLQCMELSLKQGDLYSILTSYNNLGVIYSQLNEYDSAALIATVHPQPLACPDTPELYRHHFRLLREGLRQWMRGLTQPCGMPSYADFLAGVTTARSTPRLKA